MDAAHRGHHGARRGSDDPGRVERQVDEVEGGRPSLGRQLGRQQAEDHRADGGRRRAQHDGQQGEPADRSRERHEEQDRARAAEGRDEDRPEADPIAEHAAERRHERADQRRRAHHQRDRRRQAGSDAGDALDQDGDVWPAHLDRHERDPEDEEDPPGRLVGQDAAQRGEREVDDATARDDLRPDLARAERHEQGGPDRQDRREGEDRWQRPAEAVDEDPGERRPDGEADRPGRAEDRDRRAEAGARRHVADTGQHDPGVAQLEADEQHRERDLPWLAGQGDAGEHDRLDERAPDDDHLAAVLVGPRSPERDERHADDEDQRAEQPDEGQPIRGRDAHLAQVCRQQREDLADARAPRPSR